MIGIVLVNKPSGITSSKVVVKLRYMSKIKRVGHLGTLDPLASGVLPICIGKATRLFDLFLKKDKTYIAHVEFGKLTDTLDSDGEVTKTSGKIPTIDEINAVLPQFLGEISQIPPDYSSKVVNGVRAYKLARDGKTVELKPSLITIYDIKCIDKIDEKTFAFEINCSSGTYIRSLARDIGFALGTFGTITKLTRTRTGNFKISDCVDLENLNDENIKDYVLPLNKVLEGYKNINLDDKKMFQLFSGKFVSANMEDGTYVLYNKDEVVGLGCVNHKLLKLATSLKED